MKQMDTILKAVGIKTKECQQEEKGSTRLFSPLAKKSQRAAGSETQEEENTVQEEDGADSDCQAPTTNSSVSSALTQPASAGTSSDGSLHPGDESLASCAHQQDSPGSLSAESSPPCPACPSGAKQAAGDNTDWTEPPNLSLQLPRALCPASAARSHPQPPALHSLQSFPCRVWIAALQLPRLPCGWVGGSRTISKPTLCLACVEASCSSLWRAGMLTTKTTLRAQSVKPTELSCSFQTLLRAQHMASQYHSSQQSPTAFPTDKKRPILAQISIVPQEAVAIPSLHKLFYSWGKQLPPLGIIFLVLSSWESRWPCGYL